ncbi:YkgJ family cysteine cluster protein [Candidatus Hodarchaeum mangrovi]
MCLKKKCFHCCVETEMILSPEDIKRISDLVKKDPAQFSMKTEDGLKVLRNNERNNGELVCFFLNNEGLCSIYDLRPKGCTFYPLIWDMKQHKVISDDYCPYYKMFNQFINKFTHEVEDFVFRLYGEI